MTCTELTDAQIDAFLNTHWYGILSLANGEGETYACPDSYGYASGLIYFHFMYAEDSEKMKFIPKTKLATLTIYDPETVTSVIIRGVLEKVDASRTLEAAAVVSEETEFPSVQMRPDTPISEFESSVYQIVPESVEGRTWSGDMSGALNID